MNEVCYLKIHNTKEKRSVEIFNLSIFDTLFLLNSTDEIKINKFYAVDKFGTESESHIVDKDLPEIKTVENLFSFLDSKSIYGEEFTLNIIEFQTYEFKVTLKDDYNLFIDILNHNSNTMKITLRKILRLLKFVNINITVNLLMANIGKYVTFDDNGKTEIFTNKEELSNSKIFN